MKNSARLWFHMCHPQNVFWHRWSPTCVSNFFSFFLSNFRYQKWTFEIGTCVSKTGFWQKVVHFRKCLPKKWSTFESVCMTGFPSSLRPFFSFYSPISFLILFSFFSLDDSLLLPSFIWYSHVVWRSNLVVFSAHFLLLLQRDLGFFRLGVVHFRKLTLIRPSSTKGKAEK